MNREIKFRAWDKDMVMMVYTDELMGHIEYDTNPVNTINIILNEDDYSLDFMQYTGLKDINGKEIYEGDIIEGGYLNPLTGEFLSRKYIVEYENAQFRGKLIGHSPFGDTWLHFIKGEVIGNIYENPELLEE